MVPSARWPTGSSRHAPGPRSPGPVPRTTGRRRPRRRPASNRPEGFDPRIGSNFQPKGRAMPERVKIGERWVGQGEPCFLIAEIGLNHNGDIRLAKKLIDAAALAG